MCLCVCVCVCVFVVPKAPFSCVLCVPCTYSHTAILTICSSCEVATEYPDSTDLWSQVKSVHGATHKMLKTPASRYNSTNFQLRVSGVGSSFSLCYNCFVNFSK